MKKRTHQKPAGSYGYFSFSKSGKVKKDITELPRDKSAQELHVGEKFIKSLRKQGRNLGAAQGLDENDQDFLTEENGESIDVQVVELPRHSVAKSVYISDSNSWESEESQQFYEAVGRGAPMILKEKTVYDRLLVETIQGKLAKYYTKRTERKLWLLIWSIFPYETEYYSNGELHVSDALKLARDFSSVTKHPFDEVWFFNLITRPVQIFPI